MTSLEQACEQAMHRMNESINRSSGQHLRAVRKAASLAGIDRLAQLHHEKNQVAVIEPEITPVIELVDTERLQADEFVSRMYEQQEADDAMSTVRMLGYALVALVLTGAATALAVAITIFTQP